MAITQTKVILPQRRDDIIPRTRLLELLYELLDRKLILVTASAGYGKTTLLVDFSQRVELPVCWYALDSLDNDPERFIAHFIASIQERFPTFGGQSKAALNSTSQSGLDVNRMVSTLVNEVYDDIREHFILILDDFHLVNDNQEVDRFVNLFVQFAGENCHLILSSRTLITLKDLSLMIARSQVGGLSHEELAFTAEEIKSLILRNYRVILPDAEAEALVQETEGWITGLLLSAQTMWQGMTDRARLARASGIGLYDYLAQQVLDQQPDEIRRFLLRSSLLEEFDAELCRQVFGDTESWSRLIDLILKRNLFALPVGEERRWIRYHHLFRDFLQARVARDHPEEREKILRRMVDVFSDQGEWDKAYNTCTYLEDINLFVELIETAGTPLIKNGRLSLLGEWIDKLPDEIRIKRPVLMSLKGTVCSVQGDIDHGIPLLNQADALFRKGEDQTNFAYNLVRRADILRLIGDYQASIEDASEALGLTKDNPQLRSLYAGALRSIGMGHFQIGNLDEANETLTESLEVYQSLKDWQLVAMVRMELGLANMNAGNFNQSMTYYEEALRYWSQVNDPLREANILNNLGVLHHLIGEFERAASLYEEGLARAKQAGYPRMESYILCGIGDLYADLGASESALEAYQQAREIAQNIEHRFLLLYADLAEANQNRLKGEFEKASDLLHSAERYLGGKNLNYESGLWHLEKGKYCLSTGNILEAIENLQQAIAIFDKDGQQVEASRAYLYFALAQHAKGANEAAIKTLETAFVQTKDLENQQVVFRAGREAKDLLSLAQKNSATHQIAQPNRKSRTGNPFDQAPAATAHQQRSIHAP